MRVETIGELLQVRGEVFTRGDLRIEGGFSGELRGLGCIHIARTASCRANARTRSMRIEGRFIGDITCTESIWVGPSARIVGNLQAPSIQVHPSAVVQGRIDLAPRRKARYPKLSRAIAGRLRRPTPPGFVPGAR